jgi:uncharacterized protein YjdB
MKNSLLLYLITLFCMAFIIFYACGDYFPEEMDSEIVEVSGIVLNKSSLTLPVGSSETLQVTVMPDNAYNKTVSWNSSVNSIATVNQSGVVNAVSPGTATITAVSLDGGKTAVCQVVVQPEIIEVTGVTLSKHDITMVTGAADTLFVFITPENATDKTITWSSTNTNVVSVTQSGILSALETGSSSIIAKSVSGNKADTCHVTVTAAVIPVTGVSLTPGSLNLKTGDKAQVSAAIVPENATNREVSWTSSNISVITVDASGMVTAAGPGSAVITVTTQNGGFTATCAVTVSAVTIPVTGVTVNPVILSIMAGSEAQLTATIAPADASNKSVTWSSSNTNVATVNATGLVLAKAAGTATITVTTTDGGKTATCVVTVTAAPVPVTGISVTPTTLTVNKGATGTITATVQPANATNKTVSWSSSNIQVATVNEKGEVTGLNGGQATITATTQDGGFTATCQVTVNVPVTGVTLNPTTLSIVEGNEAQLTATVAPADASNKSVTWSSSNTNVASVNATGLVLAKAAGTATITVSTVDGAKTATCVVTVTAAPVPVTGISVTPTTLNVNKGATGTISATVQPANATNKTVSWSSNNIQVATVNEKGEVTGQNGGQATITATTQDGGFTATCQVTVNVPVTGVTLNPTTLSIVAGNETQLTATISPADASNKSVTWSSSNTNVATVNATGLVLAKAAGTATITVTTTDGGKTATCVVTVTAAPVPVTGISVTPTTLTVNKGATGTITATVQPANATNKTVSWSSNNIQVATVNEKGEVTGQNGGQATITATTQDGGFTAICQVTVNVPVTGVTLNPTTLSIVEGNEAQLSATVAPADASNKSVTWSSSNTNVATVNATGLVLAKAAGTATITVTTTDGGKTATCVVTVTAAPVPVTGISVTPTTLTVNKGATGTISATVQPANATNKTVSWSSNNIQVATVNEKGEVTGQNGGQATITATTQDGGFTATCQVTVNVPVTGVTLNPTTLSIMEGNESQLSATVAPADASNKSVTWSSSNTNVATVNATGLVLAKAAGTATITVTTVDGAKTATCVVTVTAAPVPVTGVVITPEALELEKGATSQLTANVLPANATNKKVTWNSYNTQIATVNEKGLVTALNGGTAIIYATTEEGGFTDTCSVKVVVRVTGITVNPTTLSIMDGDEAQVTATVSPADATNKTVTWSSSNTKVATVNATGLVYAVSVGVASITATTSDGTFKASCSVTVTEKPVAVTGITVTPTTLVLKPGESGQLTAAVEPKNATNQKVTWSSNNSRYISVDQTGLVTMSKTPVGGAIITATTDDGSFTASCTVSQYISVTGITLSKEVHYMPTNNTTMSPPVTATVLPANATDPSITWTSSNQLIARVSEIGNITSYISGTCTITATTNDGGFPASYTLYVGARVTGVTLNKTVMDLYSPDWYSPPTYPNTEQLIATISPTNAVNKKVTWSSSNTSLATVDQNGVVRVVTKSASTSQCTITVTTDDGSKTASCTLYINRIN